MRPGPIEYASWPWQPGQPTGAGACGAGRARRAPPASEGAGPRAAFFPRKGAGNRFRTKAVACNAYQRRSRELHKYKSVPVGYNRARLPGGKRWEHIFLETGSLELAR